MDLTTFQQLDTYPWGSDEEFQRGLSSIIGPDISEEKAARLTVQAKCFYISR